MTSSVGVVLAAGRSSRMPQTKQMLPWPAPTGETTVVAAAFDSLAPFCGRMCVTLGHQAADVARALADRAYDPIPVDADAPMFTSVRAALEHIRSLDAESGALLLPCDCPGVRESTIRRLLAEAEHAPGRFLAPAYQGRAGHPLLIPRALFSLVLAHDGAGGLRDLWAQRPERRVVISADDPACVRDLDTPDDYRAALTPPPATAP